MPTPTEISAERGVKKPRRVLALTIAIGGALLGCVPEASNDGPKISPNPGTTPATDSYQAPTKAEMMEQAGIEEIEPTPTATEVVPQYTLNPEIENFRESYIPVEELLDGSYWNWLNETVAPTLVEEFRAREDKIKDDIPLGVWGVPMGSVFVYDPTTTPNYEDPETRPWKRDVTFAATSIKEADGSTLEYYVLPVFYYDDSIQDVQPVVTIIPIRRPELIPGVKEMYLEIMNIPAIIYSQSYGSFNKDNIVMEDPIVGQAYDKLGPDEVWKRTERFYQGDVSAFSGPDMIVLCHIADTDFYE